MRLSRRATYGLVLGAPAAALGRSILRPIWRHTTSCFLSQVGRHARRISLYSGRRPSLVLEQLPAGPASTTSSYQGSRRPPTHCGSAISHAQDAKSPSRRYGLPRPFRALGNVTSPPASGLSAQQGATQHDVSRPASYTRDIGWLTTRSRPDLARWNSPRSNQTWRPRQLDGHNPSLSDAHVVSDPPGGSCKNAAA